jgi:hypothetical protein
MVIIASRRIRFPERTYGIYSPGDLCHKTPRVQTFTQGPTALKSQLKGLC